MPKKIKKILLVDDNPVAQKMTSKVFSNDGYQVLLAFDEIECFKMAKIEQPDAILMDVIFPDGDGKEFVRKLKLDPDTENIPIVFATNTLNVKDDDGDLIITIGEESYRAFAKPLHYPKLLSTVRKEINRVKNKNK
ncbi:MAG: response regulator [Candidatus Omnitrophica bacterium]|nr:response regulator [Candidatus Omnitrophota bacterium]